MNVEEEKTLAEPEPIVYNCAHDGCPFTYYPKGHPQYSGPICTYPIKTNSSTFDFTLSPLVFCNLHCAKGYLVHGVATKHALLEQFTLYVQRVFPGVDVTKLWAAPDPSVLASRHRNKNGISLKQFRSGQCLVADYGVSTLPNVQPGSRPPVSRVVVSIGETPGVQVLQPTEIKGLDPKHYYHTPTPTNPAVAASPPPPGPETPGTPPGPGTAGPKAPPTEERQTASSSTTSSSMMALHEYEDEQDDEFDLEQAIIQVMDRLPVATGLKVEEEEAVEMQF